MNLFYTGRKYLEERRYERFWSNLTAFMAMGIGSMIAFQIIRYYIFYV